MRAALSVCTGKPLSEWVLQRSDFETARLLKRLKRLEALLAADRRAVLKLVDALLETRRLAAR